MSVAVCILALPSGCLSVCLSARPARQSFSVLLSARLPFCPMIKNKLQVSLYSSEPCRQSKSACDAHLTTTIRIVPPSESRFHGNFHLCRQPPFPHTPWTPSPLSPALASRSDSRSVPPAAGPAIPSTHATAWSTGFRASSAYHSECLRET